MKSDDEKNEKYPFLNVIAFHPEFLKKMWQWIALNLGYPLEAPFEATRGWTVENAKIGFNNLSHDHARILALFCQVLNFH